MPKHLLNLQLFAEEGMADTSLASSETAGNPVGDGVATETTGESIATTEQGDETWDSLIKGKYKEDYNNAVKEAISKRFKNQRDLQGQIDAIDPMMKALAQRYEIQLNPDGSIPIQALSSKILDDNSLYEQEAFERGISVEDLKQIKSLERENAQLRAMSQRSQEQKEWDALMSQGEAVKQVYPSFDMDTEMQNPQFGRLLATMQRSGFPNAVQAAYEAVHREEIMGSAMQYAVQQTQQKISNSIQSGKMRPTENGTSQRAAGTPTAMDPSKLTKAQIEDIKMRAARGEKITF